MTGLSRVSRAAAVGDIASAAAAAAPANVAAAATSDFPVVTVVGWTASTPPWAARKDGRLWERGAGLNPREFARSGGALGGGEGREDRERNEENVD